MVEILTQLKTKTSPLSLLPEVDPVLREDEIAFARELDRKTRDQFSFALTKKLFKEPRLPETDDEQRTFERELRRYGRQTLLWKFIPHPKQLFFILSRKSHRMFVGSNQSGKTTILLVNHCDRRLSYRPWLLNLIENDFQNEIEIPVGDRIVKYRLHESLIPLARSLSPLTHPLEVYKGDFYPTMSLVGAKDFKKFINKIIIPKMKELVPLDLVTERLHKGHEGIHMIDWFTGAQTDFVSYEQAEDKAEAGTYDDLDYDEPPPRAHFIGGKRGTMVRRAQMSFAFTPVHIKDPWIYDELFVDAHHVETVDQYLESTVSEKKTLALNIDIYENPFLDPERRDEFLATLNKEEYEARAKGRFPHLMGRVYKDFTPQTHVLSIDRFRQLDLCYDRCLFGCVVDPHSRRPFAMAWFLVTPLDEMIWFAEWPDDFMHHEQKHWNWGVLEYLKRIREIENGDSPTGVSVPDTVHYRLMDPNFGRTKSAETGRTLQDAFQRPQASAAEPGGGDEGMYFQCDYSNAIDDGHLLVQERLKPRRPIQAFKGSREGSQGERRGSEVSSPALSDSAGGPSTADEPVGDDGSNNASAADGSVVLDGDGLGLVGGGPRMYVTENCRNIIKMFMSYVWDDHTHRAERKAVSEKPQEVFKDFADVVRYPCNYGISYWDPQRGGRHKMSGGFSDALG